MEFLCEQHVDRNTILLCGISTPLVFLDFQYGASVANSFRYHHHHHMGHNSKENVIRRREGM